MPRGASDLPGKWRSLAETHLLLQGMARAIIPGRVMRSRIRAAVFALTALAGVLGVAADASAFCRSTTCRASSGKECPTDENGCPKEGAKLAWTSSCISFAVNERGTQDLDPEDTRAIIRKTFKAWSDVPCVGKMGKPAGIAKMTFQEREPVACKKSEYNKEAPNLNVIIFQDDDWKYRGIDGTLAKTSVTYNDETGEIYDADIEVNAANNTVTISDNPMKIQYDLQAIMTHEVGHFIGVAHSSVSDAVMFASYSPGSIAQRKLTADDIAAVCAIYPPSSGAACDTTPRNGFSATCGAEEDSSKCSVATIGNTGPIDANGRSGRGGPGSAALAFVGFGALAAVLRGIRGTRARAEGTRRS